MIMSQDLERKVYISIIIIQFFSSFLIESEIIKLHRLQYFYFASLICLFVPKYKVIKQLSVRLL